MHGIMAQKYGGNLKTGATVRSLPPAPPQPPAETFVRTQSASAPPLTRAQMQAFQARTAAGSQPPVAFQPHAATLPQAPVLPQPAAPQPAAPPQAAPPQAAFQPRALTEGDLAIKAALAQINADQAAARQALATSRLEAGKKTLEGVAKTSADLHA